MKTSIATVSIAGDLAEKLAAISAAGFDGVEIFENDFLAFDGSPRDVGRMARDAGLAITLFQPFRDFEGLPEPQRSRAFDRAERKFDVMQELGTDLMLVCSSVSPVSLGGIDRAAADFHELGERAAKRGLRVGYEALAWGRHVNDHRDAWEIVRRAAHPNIGLILNSFHTLARKIDLSSIRSIPSDKIFIVQLADAPLIDMDLLYWSRHFRNMPGEGDLPVREFMQAVAATGYDGYISLEIFNDQFRGGSAKAISVDGKRSLVWLMDQVRREEPALDLAVPSMPDRIGVEGVEFIEFAANPEGAEDLGGLLATLGFSEAGRHVSKDVTLYRQGEINIVVNTEREGFAHSSFVVHGTSAYAIGLKVEDAAATVARAEALGAEIFHQPVGPGELSIPAIRGVGGGLIYFLDGKTDLARVWDIEFRPVAAGWSRHRPHAHRPCRPDHVPGGNAELAALLCLDLPDDKDADGRHRRSRRPRPQPGDRRSGQALPPDAQRRREPPYACRPFHRRNLRLERPAPGHGDGRHFRDGSQAQGERLRAAADFPELLRRRGGALRPRAGFRRPAARVEHPL